MQGPKAPEAATRLVLAHTSLTQLRCRSSMMDRLLFKCTPDADADGTPAAAPLELVMTLVTPRPQSACAALNSSMTSAPPCSCCRFRCDMRWGEGGGRDVRPHWGVSSLPKRLTPD